MQVKASSAKVRISTKKAREVTDLIRGRTLSDALTILEYTPRKAAEQWRKLLLSAKANALHNYGIDETTLKIESVEVAEAGSYKRWRAAARGSALPYKHQLTHFKVVVSGEIAKKAEVKKTPEATKTKSKTITAKEESK